MHSAQNVTEEFLQFVVNKGIEIKIYEIDEEEEAERFDDYLEIIDFYESNKIKITNIWDVNNNGSCYYELNYIDDLKG